MYQYSDMNEPNLDIMKENLNMANVLNLTTNEVNELKQAFEGLSTLSEKISNLTITLDKMNKELKHLENTSDNRYIPYEDEKLDNMLCDCDYYSDDNLLEFCGPVNEDYVEECDTNCKDNIDDNYYYFGDDYSV